MNFSDVVAQERVKGILRGETDADRLPHALMLTGTAGAGKLPLALALGRYLLCEHPRGGEPCEDCLSCRMSLGWAHPDLHFSFPVIKKKATDQPISDDYLTEWREQLNETPYFGGQEWLERMDAKNQQMQHFVGESDSLCHKLSIKPSQGGRRVIVLWLPEKMMEACANKLLKLVEEPPGRTHFLLVSQEPDHVLGTIVSRTQRIHVPPLTEEEISAALRTREGLQASEADYVAHLAQGSYTRALHHTKEEAGEEFELFVNMMRTAYSRKIKDMTAWSEQVARLGRETQKSLLQYFQRMVRENFVHNFNKHERLNYQTRAESDFSKRFAPFINERNVRRITDELALCQRDIEQNVNAKMVFLDLIIKMTILIKQ